MNRLQEGCLKIMHNDTYSTFGEFVEKDNSITMPKRNLRFLATKMFKVLKGISPPIVDEIFNRNEGNIHNLRNPSDFSLPIVKTVLSALKTLSHLGSKI